MFYKQYVSQALLATPPRVRGIIDGQTIRRLVGFSGDGGSRVFHFDVLGSIAYRRLLKRHSSVAIQWDPEYEALRIKGLEKDHRMFCPSCGLEMLSGEFWHHYNRFHARRCWWINEEHWLRKTTECSAPVAA